MVGQVLKCEAGRVLLPSCSLGILLRKRFSMF